MSEVERLKAALEAERLRLAKMATALQDIDLRGAARLSDTLAELAAERDRADRMADWLRWWLGESEDMPRAAGVLIEHDAARRAAP